MTVARETIILRKEHFGGLLASTLTGEYTPLDAAAYEAKKKQLTCSPQHETVVKLFDPTERGYPLLRDGVSSPVTLYLELTKKCDGSCRHCFADCGSSAPSEGESSLVDIRALVAAFADIGGFYVRLTGGEPTIREDFPTIIDCVHSQGLRLGINTNGMFGPDVLDGILSRGVKDIRISLDGPESVNDAIRGTDSFRRATCTLSRIAEFNRTGTEPVQLTINVVLMKSNLCGLEEMIEMARSYGAKISFGLLRLTGRATKEEMLSPTEVVSAARRVQSSRERLRLSGGSVRINYDVFRKDASTEHRPFPFDNSRCPMVVGISVDAFGRVFPCGYMMNMEEWAGEDCRDRDLLDLWHHSPVLLRARQVTRSACRNCRFYMLRCNGGCPCMAYQCEGDIHGRDPYCVRDVVDLREDTML